MRFRSIKRGALMFILATTVVCSAALAQERQLTGQFITGYSGFSAGGNDTQGPYVGTVADFRGYWKDPRILDFDIQPTIEKGFQWSGPANGPDSNGVNSTATFLGGSAIPATISYSYTDTPIPQFNYADSLNIPGLSQTQQTFGVDWSANSTRLPIVNVHFRDSSQSNNYPAEIGGTSDTGYQDLRVDIKHRIEKWQLSGVFNRDISTATSLGFFNSTGQTFQSDSESLGWGVAATRPLPFRSNLLLTYSSANTDISFASQKTNADNRRASATLSSQWTERFGTNVGVNYFSNYSNYLLQQVIGGGTVPPGTLAAADSGVLSYDAGASFRVITGMLAHGSYSENTALSDSSNSIGDNHVINSGVNYNHRAYGGQLAAAYDFTRVAFNVVKPSNSENVSVSNSIFGSYRRPFVYAMEIGVTGTYMSQNLDYGFLEMLKTYGIDVDLSRKVGGWHVYGRIGYRKQTQDYPSQHDYGYQTYSVSLTSKRTQIDVSRLANNSLAYSFGNGGVVIPGDPGIPPIPGLPNLVYSSGSSFNATAAFKPTRRLNLRGSWMDGSRTIQGASTSSFKGFDGRVEYNFRRVMISAGYDRIWQKFMNQSSVNYNASYFYFQLRRNFQLF
jgi:hypothetical protein